MYYTYVLQSLSSEKYYIGHTENLERRLYEHNSNQSKSTKYKGPWKLVFKKEFLSRSDAVKFELKLKNTKNKNYLIKIISEMTT
jgi:putative endonuclease